MFDLKVRTINKSKEDSSKNLYDVIIGIGDTTISYTLNQEELNILMSDIKNAYETLSDHGMSDLGY